MADGYCSGRTRNRACPALGASRERRLPVQAPGRDRGARGCPPASTSPRRRALSLSLVDDRLRDRFLRLGPSRRGAGAGAALARAGRDRRRTRPPLVAGRALVRLQAGTARVARPRPRWRGACLPRCHRYWRGAGDRLLAERDDRLRGRRDCARGWAAPGREPWRAPRSSRAGPRRCRGAHDRGLRRGAQGPRGHGPGGSARDRQPVDAGRDPGRGGFVLRDRAFAPGRRGHRRGSRHVGCCELRGDPRRRPRLRRRDRGRRPRGHRARRRFRDGHRRRGRDAVPKPRGSRTRLNPGGAQERSRIGSDRMSDSLDPIKMAEPGSFLTKAPPSEAIPDDPMLPIAAMRLIDEELAVEGIPERNLATFVTTWMEPEARRVIDENLHRNFIDHAEYPQTFEIQQRCVRMLAELFNAPGETTGTSTQGSSEAIMLGALSLKWKWRQRREAAGKATDAPNLVFGGDVHVVWEKFCRYFDVEPRIVPLQPGKYTIGPEDIEPHVDENTIGVAAVVGTTFTGHADDVVGMNDFLVDLKDRTGLDVPLHIDGASGAFVWPFLYPESKWDFRLEQVRSINASGHKFGLVYPGIGWLIFRENSDLAEDLVFYENYLGKTDATFTLNFSTGSSMVLAQYYNLIRYGKAGYRRIMEIMRENARSLANDIEGIGPFQIIGKGEERLPLVAFNLAEEHPYDEFDIAFQLSAERGWMVPAYTMPPNAQDVKMMRALVKLTLGSSLVDKLADDLAAAIETLERKGAVSQDERKRVKTSVTH